MSPAWEEIWWVLGVFVGRRYREGTPSPRQSQIPIYVIISP